MNGLTHEIANYASDLKRFIEDARLPEAWFANPNPDHLAVKAANATHFERLVETLKANELADVQKIACTVLDGRRIATAFLASEMLVGQDWEIGCLEVIEPRPERVGKDVVGVDHMEFDPRQKLSDVAQNLQSIHGIIPERQPKSGHNTLSVKFDAKKGKREFKFTDKRLAVVVSEELRSGEATIIYQRPKDG